MIKIKSLEDAKARVAAFNKKAKALQKQEDALSEALEALGNEILDMVDGMDHVYTKQEQTEDNDNDD